MSVYWRCRVTASMSFTVAIMGHWSQALWPDTDKEMNTSNVRPHFASLISMDTRVRSWDLVRYNIAALSVSSWNYLTSRFDRKNISIIVIDCSWDLLMHTFITKLPDLDKEEPRLPQTRELLREHQHGNTSIWKYPTIPEHQHVFLMTDWLSEYFYPTFINISTISRLADSRNGLYALYQCGNRTLFRHDELTL